jgi:hypothetical protein
VEFLFGWARSWRAANLAQTLCQEKLLVTPDFETFLHHASDSAAPVAPVRCRCLRRDCAGGAERPVISAARLQASHSPANLHSGAACP